MSLPNTVKIIDEHAFTCCRFMTQISMPENLEIINDWAFSGCNALKDCELPFSVSHIGKEAFYGCRMTSIIIPPKISAIEEYAFGGNNNLKEIVFPESLTDIYRYAFSDCPSVSSLYIPNSVKWIGECAFNHCNNLTTLTLGSGLRGIGKENFSSRYLTKIISLSAIPPSIGKDCFGSVPTNVEVYVPNSSFGNYRNWGKFKHIIGFEPREVSLEPYSLYLTEGETQTIDFINNANGVNANGVAPYCFSLDRLDLKTFGTDVITVTSGGEGKLSVTANAPGYVVIKLSLTDVLTGIEYISCCYVTVAGQEAGIQPVVIDDGSDDSSVRYYNLNGVLMNPDNLPAGIYIRKHKGETKKILVK